jgi:threonine/homoserine/homoserine lactone efflux protein
MIADSAITYLTMGAMFGLSAGLSPGPLLTLVISETLQHNKTEGSKIAFVPLITDLPVILVTLFIFSRFSQFTVVLGLVSFLGSIYVAWLGFQTLRIKELAVETQKLKPESFKKGVLTNFLNPNPYFFWLTVGIPLAFKAYEISLAAVILFFLSFYTILVGSVIGIAIMVGRSKAFLKNKAYVWVMRILGIALLIFSIFFFYDGFKIFTHINN